MTALVSYARSWMMPGGAVVNRKHEHCIVFTIGHCRYMWVEFTKCDQFLVSQTETSKSSLGSKEESGCWVKKSVCRRRKVMMFFCYVEKNNTFLYNTTISCDILCYLDIPERSKHCSIFYQLACILNLWNCIFPCSYSIYDLFFSWYKSVFVLWIHGRYSILFFNMLCLEQISSQSWAYKVLIIRVWRYVAIAIPLVQEKISI